MASVAESDAAVTFIADAENVPAVQVGVAVTPPTFTVTERVFSEHVPLTVYEVLFVLLMVGAEVIATLGFTVSFTTVVPA